LTPLQYARQCYICGKTGCMKWIYLSPHFDDAVLSCGGLLWEQSRLGDEVEVWTICAGEPGSSLSPFAEQLHQRWQTGEKAVAQRRQEDAASNLIVGARTRYFCIPDCIYRQDRDGNFLYPSEESLFGELHPSETPLIDELARQLIQSLGGTQANIVSPLALGGHVDHRLVRRAAEELQPAVPGIHLLCFADYPYVLDHAEELLRLVEIGWQKRVFPISEQGQQAWCEAVNAHSSQISTFWEDRQEVCKALQAYHGWFGGTALFRNA
jgi:LmbE family N-acetylglucosaminyl deacetylase